VGDLRNARASIHEAWRDFRWVEYRPFAWVLVPELLFLIFALNLQAPWGMAGAGLILRTLGEAGVHYPTAFLALSSGFSRLDSLIFALLGSFLIPLGLARIQAPLLGKPPTGPETVRRARAAYGVTLVAYVINVAVLIGWELLLEAGPRPWLTGLLGGFKADLVTWLVGVIVAFAVAVVFLYVPIRAVEEGTGFKDALGNGILEGLKSFLPTLLLMLAFSWPALLVLALVQVEPALLVTRFRPELIAVLLAVTAVMNSFVNYFIYSAASRLHWLREGKPS
jgi:hypothetical protein